MSTVSRVLIVGGGIGGLCAAIALRRQNIAVDLVEIKAEWTVYGVGIIQQCNVVREMAHLGVLDRYLGAAFAFEDVGVYDGAGNLQARIPGQRVAGPQYPANVGISRLALHEVLSRTAAELGTQIILGHTVEELSQDADGVEVRLSNGSTGRYDLVVGADGLFSKVRGMLFGDRYSPRFTGQAVWRHNFPRDPSIDHLAAFVSPEGNAGLVPLADDLMYLYVTSHEPGNPRLEADQLAPLMRERMRVFSGRVAELREQITDSAKVVYKPMEVVFVDEPWFKGRVLLIGDAAHATTPHLGQGAGMAIEDAVVLGDLLGSGRPLPELLNGFMERRFERCRFISEASILVGEREIAKDHSFDRVGLVRKMMEVTAEPVV